MVDYQAEQHTVPNERQTLAGLEAFLHQRYALIDADPEEAMGAAYFVLAKMLEGDLKSPIRFALMTGATSVLIDGAGMTGNREALTDAEALLNQVIDESPPDAAWRGQAHYNLGNAIQQTVDLDVFTENPSTESGDALWQRRAAQGANLRRARDHFRRASDLAAEHGDTDHAGRALCNLANALDTSGRWLEAYEEYTNALQADPTNGNAAGNAAMALNRAIHLRLGPAGHLAAVSNRYRQQALDHRDRTVRIAGESTAAKWDALPDWPTHGHLSHSPDRDPYTTWVAENRLALAPVMEGLGTDSNQFDNVAVASYTGRRTEADNTLIPHVFAELNVLKADYLAARHIVFDGLTMIDETPVLGLHPHDTGTYVDTLDLAVYGLPISIITLGGRSALDVLDKIAVVANDYLNAGDDPGRIFFRTFWRDKTPKNSGTVGPIREVLTQHGAPIERLLALAELADDLDTGGLYAAAQTLRNRSTHRLVRAKLGGDDEVTDDALSTVTIDGLREAAVTSLRIARVAMLYLHALVTVHEQETAPDAGEFVVQLPITEYGRIPAAPDNEA